MTRPATRAQVRLLNLLGGADRAGLAPLDVVSLHTFAYLANVLSPVWDMPPLDGRVLKRLGGPFYPGLQHDLDRLVAMGVVSISGLGHEQDEEGKWRLRASFSLSRALANPVLDALGGFRDEVAVAEFVGELALALSALPSESLRMAPSEDATYADSLTSAGNVVDFGEWQDRNYSANAARHFSAFMPEGLRPTRGELLHLYVRHLRDRLLS